MSTRRALERRLADLAGFSDPSSDLEQYATPAPLAAHLVHLADLQDDIVDQTVLDLGTGTGILALGATTRDPARVVGIDRDPAALATARENEWGFGAPLTIDWMLGDAASPPVCASDVTVVMNPPFGAQQSNVHADRAILEAVVDIARVSYSIHNAGSRDFLEAFAADHGGTVTHAFAAELPIGRQFSFHTEETTDIDVVVVRIVWRE